MTTNLLSGGSKGSAPSAVVKTFNPPLVDIFSWDEVINNGTNSNYQNLGSPVLFPTSTNTTASVYIPGSLQVNGTIYGNIQPIPSDESVKENIGDISLSLANGILNLEPKQFTYNYDATEKNHYGFLAQDVEKWFPDLVSKVHIPKQKEAIKTVQYLEMIPLLVAKIQDLQKQIDQRNHSCCCCASCKN